MVPEWNIYAAHEGQMMKEVALTIVALTSFTLYDAYRINNLTSQITSL